MKNKFVQILLLLAALCSPVSVNAQTQPDDEIWYTSTSGRIIPSHPDYFGNTIVSNTYESGKGILKFKSPVTKIGMYRSDIGHNFCVRRHNWTKGIPVLQ